MPRDVGHHTIARGVDLREHRGVGLRRAVAVAAIAALCVALLPTGAGAQADDQRPDFVRGGASAQADTLGLNIVTSGATVGLTLGRSLARYRDRTATAEGRALDLGALTVLFGELSKCDAEKPLLPKEVLPPITAADSSEPGSDQSRRAQAFFPGLRGVPNNQPAGWQDAIATKQPASRASTETVYQDISFFSLTNARTETTAQLQGQLREARAVVTADELQMLNGMFRFVKPRWEAVARSGSTEQLDGGFSFEMAYVFGIPRTPAQIMADLWSFAQGLSGALNGLGVHIDLPQVVKEGRTVRVTPMAFRITDPPMGAAALRPFFDNIKPLYDVMAETLLEQDCKQQSTLQLADVVIQVLKGSGSIVIPVGGVEATTDDRWYPPSVINTPPVELPEEAPVDVPPSSEVSNIPFDDFDTGTYTDSYVPPPVDTEIPEVDVAGETEEIEPPADDGSDEKAAAPDALPPATISSRFEDGTKGGTATVVGIVALVLVLALAGGDRFVMGRANRRIE